MIAMGLLILGGIVCVFAGLFLTLLAVDMLQHPGGMPGVRTNLPAGTGAGYGRLSGGRCFAPSGDWASGNPAFAVSRGSPGAPPLTPGHGRRFPGMLLSLPAFRLQVSHQIHRHLLQSTPAARAIQQCATWRRQGGLHGEVPQAGLFRAASLRTRCAPFRCAGLSSDLCRVRDGVRVDVFVA